MPRKTQEIKYLSAREAASRYGLSMPTVRDYIKEIETCGRYPDGAVIHMMRKKLVLETAFHDFVKNGFFVRNRMKIPPYSAEDVRLELIRLSV